MTDNKQIVIKMVQDEITELMSYTYNHFFALSVVNEAVVRVRGDIISKMEYMKDARPTEKLLAKYDGDSALKEHDAKYKDLTQQKYHIMRLDQYEFLINGKYYQDWEVKQ